MGDGADGVKEAESAAGGGETHDTESEARYLDPRELRLARTAGGFVSLGMGCKSWPRAHFYRAFPASAGAEYVCIRDDDGKEIGILESLEGLAPEAAELVREELGRRYYAPVVLKVRSLKEEFGYTYWECATSFGDRRFTVQSGGNNAFQKDASTVLLIDVDGNRFELPATTRLDRKHLRVVEGLL